MEIELILPDTILLNEQKNNSSSTVPLFFEIEDRGSIEELIFPNTVLLNEKKKKKNSSSALCVVKYRYANIRRLLSRTIPFTV